MHESLFRDPVLFGRKLHIVAVDPAKKGIVAVHRQELPTLEIQLHRRGENLNLVLIRASHIDYAHLGKRPGRAEWNCPVSRDKGAVGPPEHPS